MFSGQNPSGTGLVTGVATRPGMSQFYTNPFSGNPTVNYLKTFVDTQSFIHLLSLDGLGVLRDEFQSDDFPSQFGNVVAGSFAQSSALDGREWLAIGDGQYGIDIPRQYDGEIYERVSQVGPGAPPSVSTEVVNFTIAPSATGAVMLPAFNITASPNGLIQDVDSFNVTVYYAQTWPTGSGPQIGDEFTISAATNASYDGVWTVTGVPTNTSVTFTHTATGLTASGGGTIQFAYAKLTFTAPMTAAENIPSGVFVTVSGVGVTGFNGTWRVVEGWVALTGSFIIVDLINVFGLTASGGGMAVIKGNVAAGLHLVSVCFITNEFYITKPAPYGSYTAPGNFRAVCSSIPTGDPTYIIGRILIFTPVITPPAITGPFFYLDGATPTPTLGTFPSFVITDNTTTQYTVDFTDSILESGTAATNLFNLLELGECSATASYSERQFWCGERNKVSNFNNLTFDGGFSATNGYPLGWTVDRATGSGGAGSYSNGYYSGCYQITGDGVNAFRGTIFQTAYQDFLGVPIVQPNVQYSVRVRLAQNGTAVNGTFAIDLQSTSLSLDTTFSVNVTSITTEYQEFTGTFPTIFATPPQDLLLRVFTGNTLTSGGIIYVDCIELYPTNTPDNLTQVRGSYAEDPESFDEETGIMVVGLGNGQAVRTMFTLLDNKLYLVKERSLYSTQDDNQNEPDLWVVSTVSATVGTPSVNGVGIGESWAIICSHDGAYIFWGGEPVKISQEIQPNWNTINWGAGQRIYCFVDTFNKRIHIGAPINGASQCNAEFVCDYSQLANSEGATSAEDIVGHPQAYYSSYQPNKVMAPGKSRKWTIWNLEMNCGTLALQTDGSEHTLRGNGVGNGKVYDQLASQLSDDGVAINAQYQTAYWPDADQEQMLGPVLGSHRKYCKYLTGYAFGVGSLAFTLYGQQNQRPKALTSLPLENPASYDFEMNVNYPSERMSIGFGSNAVDSWFEVLKLYPELQKDVMTPVKGINL